MWSHWEKPTLDSKDWLFWLTGNRGKQFPDKDCLDFWPKPGIRCTTTCRARVNRKQSEMFGGMGVINNNLVIWSETKREKLEFLVLITACVLQRQWAKAQHWHSTGGMFICFSFGGRVASRNCDTFLCHPVLPLTRSHTGAPLVRKYTVNPRKRIRRIVRQLWTTWAKFNLPGAFYPRPPEIITYPARQVTPVCRCRWESPWVIYLLICRSWHRMHAAWHTSSCSPISLSSVCGQP